MINVVAVKSLDFRYTVINGVAGALDFDKNMINVVAVGALDV